MLAVLVIEKICIQWLLDKHGAGLVEEKLEQVEQIIRMQER
jgi:hypothetical protein